MNKMWIIAKNTFLETLRDRALYGVLFFAVFMLVASLFLGQISLHQEEKIVRDLGLTSISLFSTVITLFLGSKIIYNEIEKRTIYLLISKPVARWAIVVGKWLGLSLLIFLVQCILTICFWGIMSIQAIDFPSTYMVAIAMSYIEQIILIAIAVCFSTFTSPIVTIFSTLMFYLIGHVSTDFIELSHITENPLLQKISYGLYYIVPNLDYFNVQVFAIYGVSLTPYYFLYAGLYAILWLSLILFLSCCIFTRREF